MSESDLTVQRQVDRICDQFEDEWSDNGRPDMPAFLEQIDKPHRQRLLEALLDTDVELREKAGLTIEPVDYRDLGDDAVAHVRGLVNSRFATIDQSSDKILPNESIRSTPPPELRTPKRIGPYKLLQQIGEGGMGTVWLAEQEKPVRRTVALKLIRGEFGSKEAIARFEAERQALAMMDHQNIAKVFDAGTTDAGAPYFVMEMVKGVPLTEYCDKNHLSVRERLELMVDVCKAVQHAHQKGIIHRDLKPSNVLVARYDGKPVPKVIDFGLAKALEHTSQLTDKTMFTQFGQVVGTLQYMSPEQAEVNSLDIDTRSDVYSLGVMLYELLTGSTPLDKATVGNNAMLQVLAIIRNSDPPLPSARLSSSGDAVIGISQQRKISPSRLQQILRGDLDWVVMKAIEKERPRRYDTAVALGDELQRFLNDEVVLARPPSVRYRVAKFVRKNQEALLVAATIAAILLMALGISNWAGSKAESAHMGAQRWEETAKKNLARLNYQLAVARWDADRRNKAVPFLEKVPEPFRKFEWHLANNEFGAGKSIPHGVLANSQNSCRLKLNRLETADQTALKACSVSPDFSKILTVSADKVATIWNAVSGEPVITLIDMDASASIACAAFGPAGKQIATGTDIGTVILWDAETGKKIRTVSHHVGMVESIGFRYDGLAIVVGFDEGNGRSQTVDLKSGTPSSHQFYGYRDRGTKSRVRVAAFSPLTWNHLQAAVSTYDTIEIDRYDSVFHSYEIRHPKAAFGDFCSDGTRFISGSRDGVIRLWDTANGEELRQLDVGAPLVAVDFGDDGRHISWCQEDGAVGWLKAPNASFAAVEKTRDGNQSDTFGMVRFWMITFVCWLTPLIILAGHQITKSFRLSGFQRKLIMAAVVFVPALGLAFISAWFISEYSRQLVSEIVRYYTVIGFVWGPQLLAIGWVKYLFSDSRSRARKQRLPDQIIIPEIVVHEPSENPHWHDNGPCE